MRSQEHKIKPKKFAQTDIDEVIIGHTNEPEYKKLQSNEFMEALRDRTVKIDVPYVTRLFDEIKIYEKDYNSRKVRGKRLAPHTLEVAAMWAVLTRLEEPKNAGLTLMQKLKLYNGKTLPGFTEDNIKELREEAEREGMHGISPRYVQDKISNALVAHPDERSINPFMVLNELEAGLKHHSLINSEETRKHYRHLLSLVKEEYEDIVKNEVQRAIAADEDALTRLCGNYIDNVKAYTQREKVKNKYTGQTEEPDERLMRSIEEKIDIPESRKDDFRREIMNYIGALALDGKKFDYRTNERLQKALELKLFQDQKDTIKLTSLVSSVVDKDTQEKIDIVKARLDPQLRLRRRFGDRRLELRRQHLRPRRRQARQPLIGIGDIAGRIVDETSRKPSCALPVYEDMLKRDRSWAMDEGGRHFRGRKPCSEGLAPDCPTSRRTGRPLRCRWRDGIVRTRFRAVHARCRHSRQPRWAQEDPCAARRVGLCASIHGQQEPSRR